MNCHEAYLWMLEAEEPAELPPAAVAEHLRGCSKCRRRQKRVLHLLTTVQQLPPPPESPTVRAEVISLVRQTSLAASKRRFPWNRWLWRMLPVAAAALVVIGLSIWLLAHFHHAHEAGTPPRPDPATILRDGDLRTRLLQRTLVLAEAKKPTEKFDALTGMASDLQNESIQQAGKLDPSILDRLAALYELVIREGVLPHVRTLVAAERQERLPALAVKLREAEQQADLAAEHNQPAASEPLRRLARTAGEASRLLDNPKIDTLVLKPKAPAAPEPTIPLVETLVVQGLRLADETDPLKRADVSTDVADSLVRTIMEASKNGSDRTEMVKLGTYLGFVMDRAVGGNLDSVDLYKSDADRRAEHKRVRKKADTTMDDLRHSVADAPPPSRPALEQAIDATRYATMDFSEPSQDRKK